MTYRQIRFFLICLFAIIVLAPMTHADMVPPTLTYVYFDQGGIPFNGSVNFTVTCYGYPMGIPPITLAPGSYEPKPIYKYSVNYTGYGSPDYHQTYLQYTHIDSCELDGLVNNQNFTIKNLTLRTLVSRRDLVLERVPRDFGSLRKYYYATPEYVSCRYFEEKRAAQWDTYSLNFSKKNSTFFVSTVLQFPGRKLLYGDKSSRRVSINRSDIDMNLDGYVAYLETCRANMDPSCPGWIAEGRSLKSSTMYRTLNQNATHIKEHPCDTFLLEADPSLILPFNDTEVLGHHCIEASGGDFVPCNFTAMIEESRFTIPPDVDLGNTNSKTGILLPGPAGNATAYRSPVESLFCSVLSRFGISCDNV